MAMNCTARNEQADAEAAGVCAARGVSALPLYRHILLEWRLTGLGLNPKEIERLSPHLYGALRSRCALCLEKRRCLEGTMDYGTPPDWKRYCPNADTIEALLTSAFAGRLSLAPAGLRCERG